MFIVYSLSSAAHADGGRVVLVERRDNLEVTVFASPTPLRAGPIDISVFIQVDDHSLSRDEVPTVVKLTQREHPDLQFRAAATRAAATNKLMQAALFNVPVPGWWDVEITCGADADPAALRFALEVGPPLPKWISEWAWFGWPAGAVLVFAVHRRLVRRHSARRTNRTSILPIALPA